MTKDELVQKLSGFEAVGASKWTEDGATSVTVNFEHPTSEIGLLSLNISITDELFDEITGDLKWWDNTIRKTADLEETNVPTDEE